MKPADAAPLQLEEKTFNMGDQTPFTFGLLRKTLFFCFPVVRHQRGGGHRGDGRGSRSDLGPAGGPGAACQHQHLAEGRQEPPQHADQPAATASASRPRGHAHLLGLRGWSGEDGTTGHSEGNELQRSGNPGSFTINVHHINTKLKRLACNALFNPPNVWKGSQKKPTPAALAKPFASSHMANSHNCALSHYNPLGEFRQR